MKNRKQKFNLFYFLLSIIITMGTGFISGILTKNSMDYYKELKKPIFSLPSFIFPIVWTILYFLMGVALYRVLKLRNEGKNVNKALWLFFIQLFLNFLWPIIFFKKRLIFIAFLELVLLILFILFTIIAFYKKDKKAACLLIPYILWCIFAAVLNFYIWFLNA